MKTRLAHSLSGWCAAAGLLALLTGKRRLAANLWRVTGLGGIGALYGAEVQRRQIPMEPGLLVLDCLREAPSRHITLSALWHSAFLVLAEIVDRQIDKP